MKDQRLEEVKKAAATDPEQLALSQMIGRGWPSSIREVPSLVRKYWTFREALVMQDGVIYKGGQVVVPELLQANYLRRLHSSHLGSQSTLRWVRDAVYWPNMADDISKAMAECPICEQYSPAQAKQRLLVHEIPKERWGKVGMDLFCCRGKDYLVVVDYLMDFFEVAELPNTLASAVVNATKQQFARHGVPMIVHTDGGPQFMSKEFRCFETAWEFQHAVSSPYNSRTNGKAESAVKIAKKTV